MSLLVLNKKHDFITVEGVTDNGEPVEFMGTRDQLKISIMQESKVVRMQYKVEIKVPLSELAYSSERVYTFTMDEYFSNCTILGAAIKQSSDLFKKLAELIPFKPTNNYSGIR